MKKLFSLLFVFGLSFFLLTPGKSYAQNYTMTVSNVTYNSNNQQLTFTATGMYDNGETWDHNITYFNGFGGNNVTVYDTNNNLLGQSFFDYPNNCSFINGSMTCTVTLGSNGGSDSLTATSPSADTQLTIDLYDVTNQSYSQYFTYGSILSTATPTPTPTPPSGNPPFTASNVSFNPSNQQLTFTASNMYDNGTNWNDEQGIDGFQGDNVSIRDTIENQDAQAFFSFPDNCGFTNGSMTCTVTLGNSTLTDTNPSGSTQLLIDLWDQHYQSYSQTFTYGSILSTPPPTTLTPIADTYIKSAAQNENEGASTFMRIQDSGNNRALVKFDESQIAAAVGSDPNYTATLKFTITSNGNNWGTNGRQIDVDRMFQDWTEGNGFIVGNNNPTNGTGSGVTWNCATDTNISNGTADCSGSTAWNMGTSSLWPFDATPTATTTITNSQTGTVSFDVTSDVQSFLNSTNPNYGWIVKLDNEANAGKVLFGSKESSSSPVLIIIPQ